MKKESIGDKMADKQTQHNGRQINRHILQQDAEREADAETTGHIRLGDEQYANLGREPRHGRTHGMKMRHKPRIQQNADHGTDT